MHSTIALLALAAGAYAAPQSYSTTLPPIPSCGWTTTLITEAGYTDTVPVPLPSANCGSSSSAPASYSAAPVSSSAAPVSSAAPSPCTEYVDGQPQCATSAAVVTQISDGQVQAPTGVVTQISDGQVQAPTGVVTQISDGQVQAPTGVVTQISDGQVQAPAPTGYYPTGGSGYAMPTGTGVMPYSSYAGPMATGAANAHGPAVGGLLAAAGFAVAML